MVYMETRTAAPHGKAVTRVGNRMPDPTEPLRYSWAGSLVDRLRAHRSWDIAIESEDRAWSYGELDEISSRLEASLAGLASIDKPAIALYAVREPSLVFALIAVIRAGFPFLILDPAYPPHRIAQCLSIARPAALINLAPDPNLPDELSLALRNVGCTLLLRWSDFCQEITTTSPARDFEVRRQPKPVHPDDLLYTAFTSGSTGFPKAILGTHGPVMHFFDWQQRQFSLTGEERVSVLERSGARPIAAGCSDAALARGHCLHSPPRLFPDSEPAL